MCSCLRLSRVSTAVLNLIFVVKTKSDRPKSHKRATKLFKMCVPDGAIGDDLAWKDTGDSPSAWRNKIATRIRHRGEHLRSAVLRMGKLSAYTHCANPVRRSEADFPPNR